MTSYLIIQLFISGLTFISFLWFFFLFFNFYFFFFIIIFCPSLSKIFCSQCHFHLNIITFYLKISAFYAIILTLVSFFKTFFLRIVMSVSLLWLLAKDFGFLSNNFDFWCLNCDFHPIITTFDVINMTFHPAITTFNS